MALIQARVRVMKVSPRPPTDVCTFDVAGESRRRLCHAASGRFRLALARTVLVFPHRRVAFVSLRARRSELECRLACSDAFWARGHDFSLPAAHDVEAETFHLLWRGAAVVMLSQGR